MIACYLLYSSKCRTQSEALQYFASQRTKDQKGVTIPSQRRYVQYFEQHLRNKNGPTCNLISNLILDRIVLSMIPDVATGEKAEDTWMGISKGQKWYCSCPNTPIWAVLLNHSSYLSPPTQHLLFETCCTHSDKRNGCHV